MHKESYSATLLHAFSITMGHFRNHLHTHDVNELYLAVSDGGQQFTVDGSKTMKAGDVFFYPAGMKHCAAGPEGKPVEALVINFSDALFSKSSPGDLDAIEILRQLSDQSRAGNYRIVDGASGTDFEQNFRTQVNETRMKGPAYLSRMKALLVEFLCGVARNGHIQMPEDLLRPANNQERIWEICRFIESNSPMTISLDNSAQIANMSRSHFQAQFRKYTGKTFTEYLNNVRAQNALKLLRETELSLEEVTSQCGFGSVSNFYLVFRKDIGMTPKEVRAGTA